MPVFNIKSSVVDDSESEKSAPLRRVLLLTYHFPPSGAVAVYRMLGLVRYLPLYGWQPVVVAPPHVPGEPCDPGLLSLVPALTPIERVPVRSGLLRKSLQLVADEAHWLRDALPACRRMIRTHAASAIITTSPPGSLHLLGMWLQWRYRLPWVACFRDPWITTDGTKPRNLRWFRERFYERLVMRRATKLVANTPLMQQCWQSAYPQYAGKMVTIPNGFDPACFESFRIPPMKRERLTLLCAGELYHGRDPRPLLDAMKELEGAEKLPVEVEFLGRQTEGLFDLSAEIASRGLAHCARVEGQVSYEEALKRMVQADMLLLVHRPGYRVTVQAKLYEYLGAGRPILALCELDSDIAWVLRESKVLHRIAPPTDVAKIKQALLELTHEVQAGNPADPDTHAIGQFTRQRMAQRFAECLDACAPTKTTPRT